MIHWDNLLSKYETETNETLKAHDDISKTVKKKQNKKRAIKAIDIIKKRSKKSEKRRMKKW